LPPALALAGYLIPPVDILLYFFFIGAIPYALTALVLGLLILRCRSWSSLVRLSLVTPAMFGVSFAVFLALADRFTGVPPEVRMPLKGALEAVFVGTVYSAPVVAVAWLLWAIFRVTGLVKNEFAT
jgi:hypothetical protein